MDLVHTHCLIRPSVLTPIFLGLIELGSRWQQAKRGGTDTPLPCRAFQPHMRDPEKIYESDSLCTTSVTAVKANANLKPGRAILDKDRYLNADASIRILGRIQT